MIDIGVASALRVHEQRGSGQTRDVCYAPGVGRVMMSDGTGTAVLTGYTIPGAVAQPGGGAAPLAFMPVAGLWWNPDESGTGYNVQAQHGVTVVTMYSYAADGDPLWYLMVGTLVNAGAGVAVSGTLEKYRGGQCASCLYRAPVPMGSDGGMTVTFTSPNAAIVQFPGGRTTQIQPEVW